MLSDSDEDVILQESFKSVRFKTQQDMSNPKLHLDTISEDHNMSKVNNINEY